LPGARATTENAAEAAASMLFGETMSKNADLHKRRIAAIPRGVGNSLAVYAERAQNAELRDVEGRRSWISPAASPWSIPGTCIRM
jgi:hypothetical protein